MLRVAITHPLRAVLVGGKVSVLGSFLRFVRRGVPCEAWRPMTTPRPTRPAAGRGAGRARGKEKRSGGLAPEGRRGRAKRARDPRAVGGKVFGLSVYIYFLASVPVFFGDLSGTTFLTPGETKIFRVGGSKYLHLHAV